MTALLTDNLPLLAGAPNGIKKLRELILELAVRGKLVPQDPNDEPTSELLKRIAEEKARLVAEGSIKKQKRLAEIGEEEKPFELPDGWRWTRVGELSALITSGSRDWAQHYSDDGAIFVRMGNLSRRSYQLRLDNIQRVSPPEEGEGSRTKLEAGDLLLSITGEVGLLGLIPSEFGEAYINQHVCLIRFLGAVRGRYLPEALRSPWAYEQYEAPQRGIKNSFRLSDVSQILLPLPPLAEQHRIVAKVDELMALCDRLEAQQADAECAHAQLVQALLDSLTQAHDAGDFAQSWQRLAEHFHTLFTTESSIDALKQTLLQLAVMGKLVPQDPNDEPASELLKRITEEKARLVAKGKIKTPKPLQEIDEGERPFELPEGWEWVRLSSICTLENGDRSSNYPNKSQLVEQGIPFINAGHLVGGRVDMADMNYITRERFNLLRSGKVMAGDILFCLRGSLGKNALVESICEGAIASSLVIIRGQSEIRNGYLMNYFASSLALRMIKQYDNGTAQPNLSAGDLGKFLLPIPPAAEQRRIVAKVDQLMALCDQLKARLNQARQVHEQLANALVEQAVA